VSDPNALAMISASFCGYIETIFMRFSVIVPVLSVTMTVALPKTSAELIFLTKKLFLESV